MTDSVSDYDSKKYMVVINSREQYSIWPVTNQLPSGWKVIGVTGSRPECLEYIQKTWVDMRPSRLRNVSGVADTQIPDVNSES